jgi:hypothetical protein
MFQQKNTLKHPKKPFFGQHNRFWDLQGLSWTQKMTIHSKICFFNEEIIKKGLFQYK